MSNCKVCGKPFAKKKEHQIFCSNACKSKDYRQAQRDKLASLSSFAVESAIKEGSVSDVAKVSQPVSSSVSPRVSKTTPTPKATVTKIITSTGNIVVTDQKLLEYTQKMSALFDDDNYKHREYLILCFNRVMNIVEKYDYDVPLRIFAHAYFTPKDKDEKKRIARASVQAWSWIYRAYPAELKL
jgi:predicted nucleic acid-binding Zn ribbon protein